MGFGILLVYFLVYVKEIALSFLAASGNSVKFSTYIIYYPGNPFTFGYHQDFGST